MIKSLLALALTLTIGISAKAVSMNVDPTSSTMQWKASKKIGSTHHTGKVFIKEGQVETNSKNEITGGTFVIDMTSIADEDLAKTPEYQNKLQHHLASADFFNVEKYPTSTFKITSVSNKGNGLADITGDLTIIGKTNSISFPAKISMNNGDLTGEASFKIDRTKWGIKYGSGNFFKELAADKIINNDIGFDLKLVAKK